MKEIQINPLVKIAGITGAVSATGTKSLYLSSLDNSRKVKATITAAGTWGAATLTCKFQDAADDSTWADVTGGGFTNLTADGTQTITFTLGSNIHIGTQIANYGKFLRCLYSTSGGTGTSVTLTVTIEDIFLPQQTVTFKLYA